MKTCFVAGLGRFGAAVARTLQQMGIAVTAVDLRDDRVQTIGSQMTCAVSGDAAEEAFLVAVRAAEQDCAVLCLDGNFEASVLASMTLKTLGAGRVICTARTEQQKKALLLVGADEVLLPEQEMGVLLARKLAERQE